MIKLSKLTDYAIALLAKMAQGEERLWAASELALVTGLPQPTVAKIMKMLCRTNLITAQRGVTGGYRLVVNARSLTLVAIIEAMDGPISVTDCASDGRHDCNIDHSCPIQGRWKIINNAIRKGLGEVSLLDLAYVAKPSDINFTPENMATRQTEVSA
jgi:FeS assembly SUF system regulator